MRLLQRDMSLIKASLRQFNQRELPSLDRKLTLLELRDLMNEKKRYSELEHSQAGISCSPRLQTARLRELDHHKLVKRQVYPTQPPSTEYSLPPLGETL